MPRAIPVLTAGLLVAAAALMHPIGARAQVDLAITQICQPPPALAFGDSCNICFVLTNQGQTAAGALSALVYVRDRLTGSTVFTSTLARPTLAAGATQTMVTLRAWKPLLPGEYAVEVTVTTDGDAAPANNTARAQVTVASRCSRGPTVAPGLNIYLRGTAGTQVVVTAGEDCTYRVRAHRSAGRTDAWTVAPSGWVTVAQGSPATFEAAVDVARMGRDVAVLRLQWIGDDGLGGDIRVLINTGDPEAPPPPQLTTSGTPNAGEAAEPINTATGELYLHPQRELRLGGLFPVTFDRYYASMLPRDGVIGALGPGWTHTYDWCLVADASRATVLSDRGRRFLFELTEGVWRLQSPRDAAYQLVTVGDTTTFLDPNDGRQLLFDRLGRLASIRDGRGNAMTLRYGADGFLALVIDRSNRRLAFSHDTLGHLVSVGDVLGRVRFEYTGELLTRAFDNRSQPTTYRYDESSPYPGLLRSWTLADGRTPFEQSFDAQGRCTLQTAAGGRYAIDYQGLTTTVTDPMGGVRRHVHDERHALRSMTDELGRTAYFDYTELGQRATIVDRLGDTTRYEYHPHRGSVSRIVHADATPVTFEYTRRTANGLDYDDLTAINHGDGSRERFRYDALGNPIEATDRAGGIWRMTYDERGQPLTMTNPKGGTTTMTYDAAGVVRTVRDATGAVDSIFFDRALPVRVVHSDGTRRVIRYDRTAHVTSIVDERGATTLFTYDSVGRRTSMTTPGGGVWRYEYDMLDNVTSIVDPSGGRTTLGYDANGRMLSMRDPSEATLTREYDAAGRVTAMIDAAGGRWQRSLDAEGIVTRLTNPQGESVSIESDRMGRQTLVRTPLGNESRLTYDRLGRISTIVDESGEQTAIEHGPHGVHSVELPEGILTRYRYDTLGALSELVDPNGRTWSVETDAVGRLVANTDPLGMRATFARDGRGRVATVTFPDGLGSLELERDPLGAITRTRYSDGTEVTAAYDSAGRLTSTAGVAISYDSFGRISGSNGIAIERNASGQIARVVDPDGNDITYRYDERGLLSEVRDWLGGVTAMSYDSAGRRRSLTMPNGVTTTYAYDRDGRLVQLTHGSHASIDLTRNARGEIVEARRTGLPAAPGPSRTMSLSYDDASRLSGADIRHDALGRVLSMPGATFAWNLASQLTSMTVDGISASFAYDGLGNRSSRTAPEGAVSYRWNLALGLPSITTVSTAAGDIEHIVHTPEGELLYRIAAANGARSIHHYDETGSTVLLTNDAGVVTDRYAYSPYGGEVAHEGVSDNPYTFVGALGVMREGSTSLFVMRARVYDGARGRFLSRDPIVSLHPRKLNPYRYALGNPLAYVDPTGRDELELGTTIGLNGKPNLDVPYTSGIPSFRLPGTPFDKIPDYGADEAPSGPPVFKDPFEGLGAWILETDEQSAAPVEPDAEVPPTSDTPPAPAPPATSPPSGVRDAGHDDFFERAGREREERLRRRREEAPARSREQVRFFTSPNGLAAYLMFFSLHAWEHFLDMRWDPWREFTDGFLGLPPGRETVISKGR